MTPATFVALARDLAHAPEVEELSPAEFMAKKQVQTLDLFYVHAQDRRRGRLHAQSPGTLDRLAAKLDRITEECVAKHQRRRHLSVVK